MGRPIWRFWTHLKPSGTAFAPLRKDGPAEPPFEFEFEFLRNAGEKDGD
jgi:hypothetical protein